MAYSLIPQGIRALITALGPAGAAQVASEQIKENPELANSIDQAFRRVLMGPSEELISKFQETPSGIVFGPDVQAQEEAREVQKKMLQPAQPGGIDMQELLMPSDQPTKNPLEDALVSKPEQIDPIVETFPLEQQGLIKVFNQKKSKDELFDAEDFKVFEEGKIYYDERYPNLTREKLPKIVDADKYFGAAATATPVAEDTGYLVHLDPKDYIKMTRKFNPEEENSKNRIQAIEYLIDNNLEVAQYPTLYVSKEGENFEVNGHEGRHRAQAFLNKGFDKIPVMVRGYSRNKEGEENKHFTVRPNEDTPSYVKEKMGFTPKKIYAEDGAPGGVLEINKSQYLDPATRQPLFTQKEKPQEINSIKTWEVGNFKDINEAKEVAEENKITFEDLQKAGIRKQIKFKKTNIGYDVYFDKKLIGEMNDITEDLKDDNPDLYKGRNKVFNLHGLTASGSPDDAFDTVDTVEEAKYVMKQVIARDLLNPESDTYRRFTKQKYDKKGLPISED
jgi:hypothetical protein